MPCNCSGATLQPMFIVYANAMQVNGNYFVLWYQQQLTVRRAVYQDIGPVISYQCLRTIIIDNEMIIVH